MSPKVKSRSMLTRSCKKNVPKAEEIPLKKTTPKKSRSKTRAVQKTPKNKTKVEPVPSSSSTADSSSTSIEENKNSKKDDLLITPKVMKYCLNAYKQSPDYEDLKKKRFNTSFRHESPRGYRDIQIFTPEEDKSPKWSENLPLIENRIQGEPGEKYADIFMSIPGISDSDEEEEEEKEVKIEQTKSKSVGKKGRKKSIGYNGTPLPDECLLTDYTSLLYEID